MTHEEAKSLEEGQELYIYFNPRIRGLERSSPYITKVFAVARNYREDCRVEYRYRNRHIETRQDSFVYKTFEEANEILVKNAQRQIDFMKKCINSLEASIEKPLQYKPEKIKYKDTYWRTSLPER